MTTNDMQHLAQEFRTELDVAGAGEQGRGLPSRKTVGMVCRRYLEVLFPIFYLKDSGAPAAATAAKRIEEIQTLLEEQICAAVCLEYHRSGKETPEKLSRHARE